jgi:AraC-like DNA-binding protein
LYVRNRHWVGMFLEPGEFFGQRVANLEKGTHSMELTWYAPGARQPEHRHSSHNLFLVLRGGHETHTQQGSYAYGCFDVAYHPARVGHVTVPQEQSMLGINFDFNTDLLPQPGLRPFAPHNSPTLAIAILEYWTAASQGRRISLQRIALEVARSPESEESSELLDQIQEGRPIAEIADQAAMHPVALNRAFRRRHGRSIGEYRRASQLVEALRRVSQFGEGLALAAIEAGFYDQSHFSRIVRQEIGVSPGELRQLIRAKA